MADAAATFEVIWGRTGLDQLGERDHGATIRRSDPEAITGRSHMPHLSIEVEGEAGEPIDAQLVVEGVLGEGGMGVVQLARQPLLDRHVAIKRVRDGAPRGAANSLFREARTMGSLEHPNIPPVHALGADDAGRPILVMKRIVGVEWAALLRSGPEHEAWQWFHGVSTEPLARHIEVLVQLCRAVHYAHGRGVLHLDLKPENAMLAEDGAIYVLDWGIARRFGEAGKRHMAGTPAYMAPELVDLGLSLSEATDVYLLGGCLHEVLTGRPPHEGNTLKEVLAAAHASEPPVLGASVPPELAGICARCLAPDPADRFASVDALREALVHWIRTRGSAEIARSAEAALAKLDRRIAQDPPDPVAVGRAFAEARFGFETALEQWPENASARVGRERALREMIDFEIARENLDHARAMLEDLGGDQALEARLAEGDARIEARRAMIRDSDLGVARGQRVGFVVALGLASIVITIGLYVGIAGDPTELQAIDTVYIGAAFDAVIVVLALVGRRWLYTNAINAAITNAVLIVGAVVLLGRINAWWGDRGMAEIFAADLQAMACGLGVGWAFLRHRGLLVAMSIVSVGAVVATVFPDLALTTFGLVTAGGLLAGGAYWYWLSGGARPRT